MDIANLRALASGPSPSLKLHHSTKREVSNHVARAAELAAEAELEGLSVRSRFNALYESCHQSCLAALKLAGFKPMEGFGHRQIALQAVEHVIAISKKDLIAMADANSLRGKIEYEGAMFEVTDSLLEGLEGAALEALHEVRLLLKSSKLP